MTSITQSPAENTQLTLDQWQSFVDSHPNSSIFHHRQWLELLHQQYGFKIRIPALLNQGEIVAAIPLLQTRSLRGTKKLISLPFTDYLPVLSREPEATERLCESIASDFRGQFDSIIIRGDQPIPGLNNECHNVRHELATNRPMKEIESSFASSIRRNLRKGQRQQLEFTKRSDAAAVDIFYRLHVLTRKKLGVPVQSRKYFQHLNEKLIKTGLGFIGIVLMQGKPIAAVVLLSFNGRLVYKYAASDPAALEHRPNDLLVSNAIRIAAEEGYRCFDFGITDKEQVGLRRFKSKWGAIENDVFYSYVLGKPDPIGGQSPAVRFAGELIKRSPTAVCRALGKVFYKYSQ